MEWLKDNIVSLVSVLFGTGSILYAVVARMLDRRKYNEEVRKEASEADLKDEEFWKQRYDVLQKETENKDNWWKERYNTLYNEFKNERTLNNEILKSFRSELNEMRKDYELQRETERRKYDNLLQEYQTFRETSERVEKEYKERIDQLENLVNEYEKRSSLEKEDNE